MFHGDSKSSSPISPCAQNSLPHDITVPLSHESIETQIKVWECGNKPSLLLKEGHKCSANQASINSMDIYHTQIKIHLIVILIPVLILLARRLIRIVFAVIVRGVISF